MMRIPWKTKATRPARRCPRPTRARRGQRLLALQASDPAFGRLYDRWFDRARDLTRRHCDGLPTDVAQDASAQQGRLDGLDDPARSAAGCFASLCQVLDVVARRPPANQRWPG
jgi:hypothetical protein